MYMYIYIYIYTHPWLAPAPSGGGQKRTAPRESCHLRRDSLPDGAHTPNLPTKIIPTKGSLTHSFRQNPYGPENSTPRNEDSARVEASEIRGDWPAGQITRRRVHSSSQAHTTISLYKGFPFTWDFPLYGISLSNGFPCIRDFPVQGISNASSGLPAARARSWYARPGRGVQVV